MVDKINYSKIIISDSLYIKYDISTWSYQQISELLYFNENSYLVDKLKTIDSYCPICSKETTFISKENSTSDLSTALTEAGYVSGGSGTIKKFLIELQKIGVFQRTFSCPRNESDCSHDFIVLFKLEGAMLVKIGQSPSIADLLSPEIKKYKILNDNIYSELNRAIGLASHGIGVGSFVYLRRIVEKYLLQPALESLIEDGTINENDISNVDLKTKIEFAKNLLPDFLVKNKKVYSILSKGIHSLEENECKQFFPILRNSIEIILDEEIEKLNKEKKRREIESELSKV